MATIIDFEAARKRRAGERVQDGLPVKLDPLVREALLGPVADRIRLLRVIRQTAQHSWERASKVLSAGIHLDGKREGLPLSPRGRAHFERELIKARQAIASTESQLLQLEERTTC